MEFNLKKSQIYKAVSFSKLLILGPLKFWRVLFLIIGFGSATAYAINYALIKFTASEFFANGSVLLGLTYIFLPFGFSVIFLEIFFNYHLKHPTIKDVNNLAEFLDFDAAMVLDKADSIDGLLFAISKYPQAQNIFLRIGTDPNQLKNQLKNRGLGVQLPNELSNEQKLLNLLADANNIRQEHGGSSSTSLDKSKLVLDKKITLMDLFASLFDFSPEFLNRFDEIVVFHPLNQEQVHQIAELLIRGLAERLREQGYFFKPTSEVVDYIATAGFDPQFGDRPMQRVIQDKLETIIARKILEGTIKKGAEFDLVMGKL